MNATLMERAANDRLVDVVARGIAFATVALFWWIWLTVWLGVVVSIAGSRSIDASPAALLAGAAVAATILLGVGLLFMNLLFTATHTRARRSLVFIRERWRSIAKAILGMVVVTVACFAVLFGLAAVVIGYAFGLSMSAALFLGAAEQVNALDGAGSLAWITGVGGALAQTYLALGILGVLIGVTYVAGRWLVRKGRSAPRGSL